jgi:hypothetical protein
MAKEKELGGSAFFVVAGAGLCILAVPLTINWCAPLCLPSQPLRCSRREQQLRTAAANSRC